MTLREQIIRDEGGHQLKLYQDTKGKWTISVGYNLSDRPISQRVSEMMFDDALESTHRDVFIQLPVYSSLDPMRKEALLNMAYTMGIGGLLTFRKMLAALQAGDYEEAARQTLLSKWATDPQQDNARARRIAEQIRTGVQQ